MDTPTLLFVSLVVIGFVLIAAEVFIPGGVIGIIGFLVIAGAAATGFVAFGPQGGTVAMASLVVSSGAFLVGWLYIFPKTPIGKSLTLSNNGVLQKANPDCSELLNQEGEAVSNLGPAGIARINNKRVDVVAESSWIDSGSTIKVVEVTGNRIVVRKTTTTS
jgi:membrane-bound serine protease (ClpP class)